MADFLEAMGLIDVWRTCNPTSAQYTFHSGVHGSLSRIDYLLCKASQLPMFDATSFLPRGISDHSPIIAHYGGVPPPTRYEMVLNPWFLKVPMIRDKLAAATKNYFDENDGSVDSDVTLWEAYKVVIRGCGSQKRES